MSSPACWLVLLCCGLLLKEISSANADSSDTAKLLAHVNDVSSPSDHGSKAQRSIIYRDDYHHQSDGYGGGHDSLFPFEMRPPFASDLPPAGRSHRLNDLFDHPAHHPAGKYAPGYKYQRPQHYPAYKPVHEKPYTAPVYVPRGHLENGYDHQPDPFLAVHQRVNAQFEPEHAPPPPPVARYPPPPPHEVHLVPLQPVYHAPPPPVYHSPPPYAHEFPYSEHEKHPASRRPHAKALGALNPAPFIAAIANAYEENEKNFGVNRQGKLDEHHVGHRPRHPRPHPVFPEHPVFPQHPAYEPAEPRYPGPHEAPYPALGPLYALAAAGSEVSSAAVKAKGKAMMDEQGQEA